ncbi:hypothetical protein, partial [Novipirellula maiorica]|uniref:hypothetical protein n=1 Tax=Novipirellula maiorica TaxID=1265734 RepID=UPI001F391A07
MNDQLNIASFWNTTLKSSRSHASGAARRCPGPFGELILSEAAKFCEQTVPQSHEEYSKRTQQSMSLTTKISSISHAAFAARRHPKIEDSILNETKAFCDRVSLSDDVTLESMALTQAISNMCF